jgi:hypothetical protein
MLLTNSVAGHGQRHRPPQRESPNLLELLGQRHDLHHGDQRVSRQQDDLVCHIGSRKGQVRQDEGRKSSCWGPKDQRGIFISGRLRIIENPEELK